MSKFLCVSLFKIFSAVFLLNIILIDLLLGKLSQIKRVNFLLRHRVAWYRRKAVTRTTDLAEGNGSLSPGL